MKFQPNILFILCVLLSPLISTVNAQSKTYAEGVQITLNTKIKLSEQLLIGATIWKPNDSRAKYPTVLVSTPYVSNESHRRARYYALNGYAMVSIDIEGRGASNGTFIPFSDHGPMVCEAIKWVKKQKWSNGEVMMRGGSYRGMVQWMAARKCPDEILTMIPTASVYPGYDFPLVNGHRMQKYAAGWLGFVSGSGSNLNYFTDSDYWKSKEALSFQEHIPMNEYDDFIGAPSDHFQHWINSLSDPTYWHTKQLIEGDYASINFPVLTVTGLFDGDQPGSLRYYKEHNEAINESSHFLVIGPWDHGGTRNPRRNLSEQIHFGPEAVIDMDRLNIDWFNWISGRGPRPNFLKDKVAYYVGGKDKWFFADSLKAISEESMDFFLSADTDQAYDVFNSGQLTDAPTDSNVSHEFISDPLNTQFLDITESNWNKIRDGDLLSQFPAFLPETLVFHSPAFKQEVSFAGQITSTLYLEVDKPDVDIFVTVYAIFPDGKALYLGGDVVRGRFRHGMTAQLLEAGSIEEFNFNNFLWNAWALPRGTRLRFTVGPYNDPSAQKNYNSGGRLGFETKEDAKKAKVILHHNSSFPSRVRLPLMTQ